MKFRMPVKIHVKQVGPNVFASLDNKHYIKMNPTDQDGEWYCELNSVLKGVLRGCGSEERLLGVFFLPEGKSFVQTLRFAFDVSSGKRNREGFWENVPAEFILHLTPSA